MTEAVHPGIERFSVTLQGDIRLRAELYLDTTLR